MGKIIFLGLHPQGKRPFCPASYGNYDNCHRPACACYHSGTLPAGASYSRGADPIGIAILSGVVPSPGIIWIFPIYYGHFLGNGAIPPSLLTAIYLAEYAHSKTRTLITPFIDLLAGIPSVVYGVWGMLTVVPFIEKTIAPALKLRLGILPLFQSENPTGYGVLAGGVVLAVMVLPIIIAVAEEVISAVPQGLREASLALGATRWHTVRHVVLRQAGPGVVAAVVLGFSRAFGETMAVLMVVGNVPQVPHSILDAAYPLTALIANNYGEMMSIPRYDAALLGAALILLLIVLIFNIGSRLILMRMVKKV